jgi:hypothetical protein
MSDEIGLGDGSNWFAAFVDYGHTAEPAFDQQSRKGLNANVFVYAARLAAHQCRDRRAVR